MMSSRLVRVVVPGVVVVLVGAIVGWLPARSAASDADARADAARAVVDELTWELDDLDTVVTSVGDLRAEKARHEAAIPSDVRLAEFILDLEALSAISGVDILDVVPTSILGSIDDAGTPAGTSSVVVAVALSGQFADTLAFLDELATLPRLVVTEAIAVGFDEVGDNLAIDLELRIFTTKELVGSSDDFLDEFEADEAVDGGAAAEEVVE